MLNVLPSILVLGLTALAALLLALNLRLAVAAGRYFPGLVSSPFIGVASVWLLLRLHAATRPT